MVGSVLLYFLLSLLVVMDLVFKIGLTRHFGFLLWTGYVLCLPGAIVILLALIVVLLPIFVLQLGVFGLIVDLFLVGFLVWERKAVTEWFESAAAVVRTVVEFFAWLSFVFGGKGFEVNSAPEDPDGPMVLCTACGAIMVIKHKWQKFCSDCGDPLPDPIERDKMPEKSDLVFVKAEMVALQERYPDLPTPPKAFYHNAYEGWFAEARKRFQLESYDRTQAQREAVLKRIAEINDLYLRIARQEGEKQTFEQEQRIRKKQLDEQEAQLDDSREDRLFEREKKRLARQKLPAEAPQSRPRLTPLEEAIKKMRETARAMPTFFEALNELEVERTLQKNKYPTLADEIDKEYNDIVANMRDRP